MNWTPTYPAGWATYQPLTQGPVVGINEIIRKMQNCDYPPPQGYRFMHELGTGSCGKVYLAQQCITGCLYAVKCVKIFPGYTALARGLWNEVMIMKANPHTHLIKCYGTMQSLTDHSIMYLFLEYMEKGSVRHWYSDISMIINEAEVRKCISQVLLGLVHLHAMSIVHRDIKGDNILKDSKEFYKIADFGITKQCYGDASSGTFGLMTAGMGTPTHMAPEVMSHHFSGPYDMKADIWSLGCLILEILSRGTQTVTVRDQQAVYNMPPPTCISPQCADFIQLCLQVNPTIRPTSILLSNHNWFSIQLL